MLIDKYIFFLPRANSYTANRLRITRQLRQHELFCMYAVRKMPKATAASILRYASKANYPLCEIAIYRACKFLEKEGLLQKVVNEFSLSITGREYLALIRKFMVNKRVR